MLIIYFVNLLINVFIITIFLLLMSLIIIKNLDFIIKINLINRLIYIKTIII